MFINQLLREICQLKLGASLSSYDLSCPSFADDMTLVACYPSCLNVLMQLAYRYSCWRYQFSHTKTVVVAFGESPAKHRKNKQTRNWSLGPDHIDEEDKYVNLGVHKNYCGSFSRKVDENIAKTRKKTGMLFPANFVRKCINPMIYLKFWKQACIPTLLFGAEVWSLTTIHLEKPERCQRWFIKMFFQITQAMKYWPLLVVCPQLLQLSTRKSCISLAELSHCQIPDVVKAVTLLDFFEGDNSSLPGFLHDIVCFLEKYELMSFVPFWKISSLFPSYRKWKSIVNNRLFRMHDSQLQAVSLEVPNVKLVLSAFAGINPIFTGL